MSFPNVIYGDYGDEKRAQSTKIGSMSLGVVLILSDGREYQHGKASTAAALSAGYLCCGSVTVDSGTSVEFGLVAATAAVGATSVVVTLAAGTAVTTDKFAEGVLVTASSTGTGIGLEYKIKSNGSAAAGSACTISLYEEDSIQIAIAGGTTRVGLRENPLNNVVVVPASTGFPGKLIGVPQTAVSAGFYTWFQTKGYSPGYVSSGTAMVTGDLCNASTGYAGAFGVVEAGTALTSRRQMVAGQVVGVANTTGFTVIDLQIS